MIKIMSGFLSEGSLHENFDKVIAKVVEFNKFNGCTHTIKKRNKKQLSIRCSSSLIEAEAECAFAVNARAQQSGVKITKSVLSHSCSGINHRKRQIKGEVLKVAAPSLRTFNAAPLKQGKTKFVQEMLKKDGFLLHLHKHNR